MTSEQAKLSDLDPSVRMNECAVLLYLRFNLPFTVTFICTMQVGWAMRAELSEDVLTSTRQSKSTRCGKDTAKKIEILHGSTLPGWLLPFKQYITACHQTKRSRQKVGFRLCLAICTASKMQKCVYSLNLMPRPLNFYMGC